MINVWRKWVRMFLSFTVKLIKKNNRSFSVLNALIFPWRDGKYWSLWLENLEKPGNFILIFFLQEPNADTWPDAITALRDALKLEAHVTRKIRDIIKVCEEPPTKEGEPFNDYHVCIARTTMFILVCWSMTFKGPYGCACSFKAQ